MEGVWQGEDTLWSNGWHSVNKSELRIGNWTVTETLKGKKNKELLQLFSKVDNIALRSQCESIFPFFSSRFLMFDTFFSLESYKIHRSFIFLFCFVSLVSDVLKLWIYSLNTSTPGCKSESERERKSKRREPEYAIHPAAYRCNARSLLLIYEFRLQRMMKESWEFRKQLTLSCTYLLEGRNKKTVIDH